MNENDALVAVAEEYDRAAQAFGPFHSGHEGWAVIHEEMEELWAEVKRYPEQVKPSMRHEAIQVAAMAIRFLVDCC